jgi:hypothetical protein
MLSRDPFVHTLSIHQQARPSGHPCPVRTLQASGIGFARTSPPRNTPCLLEVLRRPDAKAPVLPGAAGAGAAFEGGVTGRAQNCPRDRNAGDSC